MARRNRRAGYDTDDQLWPADGAYTVAGYPGIAFRVLGWETAPDEDTHWTGIEERTGRVLAVMIGDDHRWKVDPEDISELAREEYCGECGQIGCGHDGLDRSAGAE